jgi:hypothetical protein
MDANERFDVVLRVSVEVTDPLQLAAENDALGTVNGQLGVIGGTTRNRVSAALSNALFNALADSEKSGFRIHGTAAHFEENLEVSDPEA